MPLRIVSTRSPKGTVIEIQGRLVGEGVAELERACGEAQPPIRLDLKHLEAADEAALHRLRQMEVQGTKLTRVSPYIELQLRRKP